MKSRVRSEGKERGTSATLLGAKREQLVDVPKLGDYSTWLPDGEDGVQLTSYWGGKYNCLLSVRGVARDGGLHWALKLAGELPQRVR